MKKISAALKPLRDCADDRRTRDHEIRMRKPKILVVDDSKVVAMTTKMVLSSKYECVAAENGAIAVAMALTEKPDLILMDVVMPTMDGFEACRMIRAQAETSEIPIIIVTTRGEGINIETGYQCGCNDYVTKPINGPELITKIENLIRQDGERNRAKAEIEKAELERS